MSEPEKKLPGSNDLHVPKVGYIALFFAIILFSGFLSKAAGPITVFDFNTISGQFGVIQGNVKTNFYGAGGFGARDGFLYTLTLFPLVMLALGIIEVVDHLGGLKAAQKLITPILKPIMGVPGIGGLAMITNLQSTDAGAAMLRELRETGQISEKDRIIYATWMLSAGGAMVNFFAIGSAMFAALQFPVFITLSTLIFFKFFGAILMRIYLERFYKGEID
jgi:nucleoside recognition membrane protein YjiH